MPNGKTNVTSVQWNDIIQEEHENRVTMKLPDVNAGYLQHLPLAPGIFLSFIHINTDLWPVPPQEASNHVLLLNYCLKGRCEVTLSNGKYAYLSDQQFALSLQQLSKPCLYPTRFYEGIEFFLDLNILRELPFPVFAELNIDLLDLCDRFHLSDTFHILALSESLTGILADRYGIGETSLKTYFKGVYGENISAFMRKKRMSHAAELLATTRLKISEIALQVGYDNQSKFAAVFKKEFGLSPLEYRRSKNLENR